MFGEQMSTESHSADETRILFNTGNGLENWIWVLPTAALALRRYQGATEYHIFA